MSKPKTIEDVLSVIDELIVEIDQSILDIRKK